MYNFEQSHKCTAQKPYCHSLCGFDNGNGSEIPLTLLLVHDKELGRQALKQLNTREELSKKREEEQCEEKYFLISYSGYPQCLL
jgi:hypothetical protein